MQRIKQKAKALKGLGGRLKRIRQSLNLTKAEMGRRLLLNDKSYYKYETDERCPNTKTLKHFSQEYNISMDWLMFGIGGMYLNVDENRRQQETALVETRAKMQDALDQQAATEKRLLEAESKIKALTLKPEISELVDSMEKMPVLHHEIMAYFQRFKGENAALIETTQSAPPKETETSAL